MPRPLQRMPLELGLDLNINQLLRDPSIKLGQITPLKDFHWLDADGDTKANARITADMTKGSTAANAARYGTMHIVADWATRLSSLLLARAILVGGSGISFVRVKADACPSCGRRQVEDFSPDGSHGAIALRIFPSITHRGLGRIIWLTSFATASAGRVRLRIGMCHRSRRGCGGGPMNTFPRDARDIALKPRSHRENIASMATWFSLRANLKNNQRFNRCFEVSQHISINYQPPFVALLCGILARSIGPARHLSQCSNLVVVGGEADIAQTSSIGRK